MRRFLPHEAQGTGEQCGEQTYNLLEARRQNRRKSIGKRRGLQLLAARSCSRIGGLYALAASLSETGFTTFPFRFRNELGPIAPPEQSVQAGTGDPRRPSSAQTARVEDEKPFFFRRLERSMCLACAAYHQGEPAHEPDGTGGRKQEPQRESPHSILNTPMNKSAATISDTISETISATPTDTMAKDGPKKGRPVTRKRSASCVQGQAEAGASQKAKACKR